MGGGCGGAVWQGLQKAGGKKRAVDARGFFLRGGGLSRFTHAIAQFFTVQKNFVSWLTCLISVI